MLAPPAARALLRATRAAAARRPRRPAAAATAAAAAAPRPAAAAAAAAAAEGREGGSPARPPPHLPPGHSAGRVLVLAGPTGSGKSAVALELARLLGGGGGCCCCELVSADSQAVYSGLDVGTAKATAEERALVAHHCLDTASPAPASAAGGDAAHSAGDWLLAARAACASALARGAVPLVVGGSGFYLRWLTDGPPGTARGTPAGGAAARASLAAAAREALAAAGMDPDAPPPPAGADGRRAAWEAVRWAGAAQALADAGDPATAARLARNDWYRLERALEVVTASGGRPMADFAYGGDEARRKQAELASAHSPGGTGGGGVDRGFGSPDAASATSPPSSSLEFAKFVLVPTCRVAHYRALDARCVSMLAGGLVQEAATLWAAGHRPPPRGGGDGAADGGQGGESGGGDAAAAAAAAAGAPGGPAARAVGYRTALGLLADAAGGAAAAHSDGDVEDPKEEAAEVVRLGALLDAALADFQRATRNCAKRQATWFRSAPGYAPVPVAAGESAGEVAARVAAAFLAGGVGGSADGGGGGEAAPPAPAPVPPAAARAAEKARLKALAAYAPSPDASLDQRSRETLAAWLRGWARGERARQAGDVVGSGVS